MTTDNDASFDATAAAGAATAAILADLAGANHQAVVVDSPPGAGKSTLVVRVAGDLVDGDEQPIVVAQTNNQVDDLVVRLATEHPGITVGRLSASSYTAPPAVTNLGNTTTGTTMADLAGGQIIVGTSAKWATVRHTRLGWAILDESYQMRSDMLLQIVERFDRGLFVGDPGQLDPFTIVGTERWIGLSHDPTQNGVIVMLEYNKDSPAPRLPVSWRLPATAGDQSAPDSMAAPARASVSSPTVPMPAMAAAPPGGSAPSSPIMPSHGVSWPVAVYCSAWRGSRRYRGCAWSAARCGRRDRTPPH